MSNHSKTEDKIASSIIKKARNYKELTQNDFGKLLGCPQSLVSKYESGQVDPPSNVIIQCMTILDDSKYEEDISVSDVSKLIKTRLDSPKFGKIRAVIADLIRNLPA